MRSRTLVTGRAKLIMTVVFAFTLHAAYPAHAQDLVVREVASSKGSASMPFGVISDMLEIADGRILVTDEMVGEVHAWHPERGRVVRFARKGEGPGEVTTPSRLTARPSGGFALYDIGKSAVLLFDAQAEPERVVQLEGGIVSNPKSMAVFPDGSLAISGGRLSDPRHIHRYSAEGRYVGSYGEPSPSLEMHARIQSAGGALRRHPNAGFLFSHGAPLRIERFPGSTFEDPDTLVEDLSILPELQQDELEFPSEEIPGGRVFRWWHDRSTGVVVLRDGRILNVITRFYSGDSVWDLYSPAGTLKVRQVIDRAYYLYGVTSAGELLASYRDPMTDEHVAVVLRLEAPE